MIKGMFVLTALVFALLLGTECRAATCSSESEVPSCTNTFSPTDTTGTYDFFNDGRLIVHFDTVLTTFALTATVDHTIDPLDPNVFPPGTVCVVYEFKVQCDEYDFSGNKGGPNGVPVRNTDYKGLITVTLSYRTAQTINTPAFGHAPGDNATAVYDENFLSSYSQFPLCEECDPTMSGQLPGLSAVAAFDEPLVENDKFCFVSPTNDQPFTVGQVVEVAFQLFAGGSCTGTPIRDKDARFSLSTISGGFPTIVDKEEGNKVHWHQGVNEFDFGTAGLPPGEYTITVIGSKFSPQSIDIDIVAP